MTHSFYRLPSPLLSTSVSCSLSSRRLCFRRCITNICTFSAPFLLLCFHNHVLRSILMSFPFLQNSNHISIGTPCPARHLLGVGSSDFATPIHSRLILLRLQDCSHNHSLSSIAISRLLCRLSSSHLSTSASSASCSLCRVLLASHQKLIHVGSSIVYSCTQNHECRSILIALRF